MEPISMALLAALAAGAGGEAGRHAWEGLTALVRRPFRRDGVDEGGGPPPVSSGEAELTRLAQSPSDPERAQSLSTALAVRAALDADFRELLTSWRQEARLVRTGDGEVRNEISGGTMYGPVVQGRDVSGLSITMSAPPVAPRDSREAGEDGPG